MAETRKLAADVVGYSRLADTDQDRTLARLRSLRRDLIAATMSARRVVWSNVWAMQRHVTFWCFFLSGSVTITSAPSTLTLTGLSR
jgi:class 3 adenylate cyclase